MAKLSEIEKKLSEIKVCAQELYKLLKSEPIIDRWAGLCTQIDNQILHDQQIMNIEATPPVIENEDQAQ